MPNSSSNYYDIAAFEEIKRQIAADMIKNQQQAMASGITYGGSFVPFTDPLTGANKNNSANGTPNTMKTKGLYKVGDKVYLRLGHSSRGIRGITSMLTEGIIVNGLDSDGEYQVSWPNGDKMYYEEKCLVLINNSSNGAKNSMTKFKIGDTIKFNSGALEDGGRKFKSYFCDIYPANIPSKRIKHGSTIIDLDVYKKNGCEIVDTYNEYLLVKVFTEDNDFIILGWREEQLLMFKEKGNSGKNSKKIDTKDLDSVIMPQDAKDEIIAVLKQHENCSRLFEEWGLSETIEYGKGMTFLFYGTPGTGKTWCANRMAKAIGTTLLSITPAEIQSQEPGGANRAIQQAFKTASEKGQVLLIDECDGLITERGGVGMILSSEINTLLTEIEKFEGVCVLTTNRADTLDQALERRISLIIEFKEPNREAREMLWGKLLPSKMPIGKNVNPRDLSAFVLTGGQIKNAILQAARMAMSENAKKVELSHIENAILRINQSKNLLGTASRYRQVRVRQDVQPSASADKAISDDIDVEKVIREKKVEEKVKA